MGSQRDWSPNPGSSTLTTSAPHSPSVAAACGPWTNSPASTTLIPSNAPATCSSSSVRHDGRWPRVVFPGLLDPLGRRRLTAACAAGYGGAVSTSVGVLSLERDDDVALILLNRPQARNAVDLELALAICAAVTDA